MKFTDLRNANHLRHAEWWGRDGVKTVTLEFRGNGFAGEVGEACNVIKKLTRERLGILGSRASKESLAEELADVIICTDLIAMDLEIDLAAAVAKKFNLTSHKLGLQTVIDEKPPMTDQTIKTRDASLATLLGGAIIEMFDAELDKAAANIMDPNTESEATRTITLKVDIKPHHSREMAEYSAKVESKLAGDKAQKGTFFVSNAIAEIKAHLVELGGVDAPWAVIA